MVPDCVSGSHAAARVPKLSGADVELGNFVLGTDRTDGTGREASRLLLAEFFGFPTASDRGYGAYLSDATTHGPTPYGYDPQDWGRRYLPSNGGCAYIDLDHLEVCLPETLSAYDHVASFRAMLRLAEQARQSANRGLKDGRKVQVLVNNSDGLGHSYGSHLSFLLSRRCWENLFSRKLHFMLYLAAYQVSSIVFTGQGKVGSEDGQPDVGFQIAQRADFFRTLIGAQTTCNRPIVNSRDEALCGGDSERSPLARLHVIFYDSTLAQTASVLKVGVMQLILTLIENECVRPDLLLDDPLDAVRRWSHDPTLETRVLTASGNHLTAIELQWLFLEEARRFDRRVGFEGCVPRSAEILDLWEATLAELDRRDWVALGGKLDWVLKREFLDRAIDLRPDLDWASSELKHLDHIYASLDPGEGLYWDAERRGRVDRIIDEERVQFFVENPPEDTRAWMRAMLLRQGGRALTRIDWDWMEFRIDGEGHWPHYGRVEMANPLESGLDRHQAPVRAAFRRGLSLEAILEVLRSEPTDRPSGTRPRVSYHAYPLFGTVRSVE